MEDQPKLLSEDDIEYILDGLNPPNPLDENYENKKQEVNVGLRVEESYMSANAETAEANTQSKIDNLREVLKTIKLKDYIYLLIHNRCHLDH